MFIEWTPWAKVTAVKSGTKTLKDAINEAMYWATNKHYLPSNRSV